MATAACGINCDVCRLKVRGICSSCGSGTSREGIDKQIAQERILGSPCPILACAAMNQIEYCPRDCHQFPCENFESGPYPYAGSFLEMQKRRLAEKPPARTPSGSVVQIPEEYWDTLAAMDAEKVCFATLAARHPQNGFLIPFLNREVWVDVSDKQIRERKGKKWIPLNDPLLELVVLLYLQKASPAPLMNEMVTAKELREGHFFVGFHELDVGGVADRFGTDPEGFRKAATAAGGVGKNYADQAYRFLPLPKIPVTYMMWFGDEEFKPRVTVCFDRSIEAHLAADGIWALVKRISFELLSQ